MNGYATQILRVNLSTGRITTEVLDANVAHCTIGGRGMAAEFLLSEVPAGIDALGPDNKLAVATGPFQNTPIPGAPGLRFVPNLRLQEVGVKLMQLAPSVLCSSGPVTMR